MRHVTDLPVRVREIENIWIPLRDGIRLAARVWLPETAESHPAPVVLEYIPYRKRDMTALRDTATHGYLAGHGYACVRLDVRGIGDSEGTYGNQFAAQYVDDAMDAVAWLARQPWSTGEIAMFGLSWGAAIALQTAARRPPALKTIICAAGIDDRHALRYPGGCLSTATVSSIAAQMSYATRPPDPAIVGQRWREMWLTRLAAVTPMAEAWLAGPRGARTWLTDPAAVDYGRIACPAHLSAGWADPAFAAAMLRTLARLDSPRLGIFGAWAHRYPHFGIPGPAIGYLQETLRWLDHWLKGRDTGIMRKPRLRAWLPEGFTVAPTPEDRRGRWISEPDWPSPHAAAQSWWLGAGCLAQAPQPDRPIDLPSALTVASAAGEFMPIFSSDRGPELPGDQSAEDARALVFDSTPLRGPIELLGTPSVRLELETEEPAGQIVIRLCEVTPDGRSRRLSWGARELALTDDLAPPRAPFSKTISVDVPLFCLADSLSAGNRLRIALSNSYWPILWPSARSVRITLHAGRCRLLLPVRPRGNGDRSDLGEPEAAPPLAWTDLRAGGYRRSEWTDSATGEHVLAITDDMGTGRIEEIGLVVGEATTRKFRIRPDDPASATLETEIRCSFSRDRWSAETTIRGRVARDGPRLSAHHAIRAAEGKETIFAREWQKHIDRLA